MTPRQQAELDALRFLRDHGPHTLPNPIETEEALAAAVVLKDLADKKLADCTNFGGGYVQYAITVAGLRAAA